MSRLQNVNIKAQDSASIDAFDRLRVSNPFTIFDSKQIFDKQPLFWDDQQVSGTGTLSNYNQNKAATTIQVDDTTAGKRVRQTFRRFNYQPGKSQLIFMTFKVGTTSSGVTKQIGIFDDDNGVYLEKTSSSFSINRRTKASGSVVNNTVAQASWNLDTMDGNGSSGINIDTTKTQILIIDIEWLGVGRVRCGFVVDGIVYYFHEFLNANNLAVVYMSTPNLPLRYVIENDGTGAASTMDTICASIISEGGQQDTGVIIAADTGSTHLNANTANTVYAVIGVRLKSTHLGATIDFLNMSMISETADDFRWALHFNPTVDGTFTYSDITNSACQRALGATANDITDEGTVLASGYASTDTQQAGAVLENALRLGAAIDGTRDEIVLSVTPLSANADIQASLNWRELS